MAISQHVPKVDSTMGIIALILNIIPIPGLGTIIAGVVSGNDVVKHVIIGVLQLVFSFLLIGYIWSIVWGIFIFLESR
ncbi:MAG: hypothetical protein ACPHK8_01130 [Thermoplasmatota archaeon]